MSGRIVVELNSILLESFISWGKYKFCVISKVRYWKFSRPPLWTLSLLFKWWKNQCILWSRRATARRMDGGHWSIDRGCWGMDGGVWCTFNGTVHFSKGQSKFNNVTCWAKRKIFLSKFKLGCLSHYRLKFIHNPRDSIRQVQFTNVMETLDHSWRMIQSFAGWNISLQEKSEYTVTSLRYSISEGNY